RLRHGLTPWRRRGRAGLVIPRPRRLALWRERWQSPTDTVAAVAGDLRARGFPVLHGGAFDRWDVAARAGALVSVRIAVGVEDHARGRQLVRARIWPRVSVAAV